MRQERPPVRPRLVEGLRLERLVGTGGEGEVWEARDERGRRRALKLVRPQALATPGAVTERAAFLARIDHPAFVRVHRSGLLTGGALDGWGFVEMDYVQGRSLADAPGDWGLLDRLLPLADALDLLHAGHWSDGLPLVHRDVKPANIVATADGRLVLVDPSTLRGVDAGTLTAVGTPVFAAPEVVTGRVGPPADVYSFAVTALALLSGTRGTELAELVSSAADLDVPAGIAAGLAPAPADRPVSCRGLLTEAAPLLGREAAAGAHQPLGLDVSPAGELPVVRSQRAWPWVVVLVALLVGPVVAWAGGLDGERLVLAAVAAGGLHLAAHAVDRRSLALAVAAPPIAWAFLLGDRLAVGRRRAWARAVLCGPFTAAWAAPVAAVAGAPALDAATTAGLVAAATAVTLAGATAVRLAGAAGAVLRFLLLPAWAAGAAVLLGVGVVALPVAVATGRGRPAGRLIVGTLAGAVETLRSPRRL